jgi:hypothetical protein
MSGLPCSGAPLGAEYYFDLPMQRHPMPVFWIVVQVLIVICVLISAAIVVVKL